MTKLMTSILVVALCAVVSLANANEKVVKRIKPVGSVCLDGIECASTGSAATAASGSRTGADVYGSYCVACHGTGAMGAPKMGDIASWEGRLAKGMSKTLANAIRGLNEMPMRGSCADCSDEELEAAIRYMTQ